MAKKVRATFQKREKERARQQKQQDKEQRRLAAKARRAAGEPDVEGEEVALVGTSPEPQVLPVQSEYVEPTR